MTLQNVNSDLEQTAAEIELIICALYRILRRPYDKDVAGSGLTVPQVKVLEELAAENGLSLKDLSSRLALSHSTASGIVDRLERRELVRRESDAKDRRISRVWLTKRVHAYVREAVPPQRLGPLITALDGVTPKTRQALLDSFRQLRGLMDETESDSGTNL